MKIARYLSITMLGLFVFTIEANADPTDSVPSASDPNDNLFIQPDPDGVPLSVTQPQSRQLTQEEVNEIHKRQVRAALDKNWLLRGYEQQLQTHAAANSSRNQDANLFYQLSSNKELAKLAGLPALDLDTQNDTVLAPRSNQASVTLRADASSTAKTKSGFSSPGNLFKPMITPFSAPNAAGPLKIYPSLPVSMASPFSGNLQQTPPAPKVDLSQDSTDIETPGMIAAKKNPLQDLSSSDLTLDILPGESIEQARAHQDNNTKLELPLPMDANQLRKEQAAALSVPSLQNTSQTTTPTPVKPVPINDEDAPLPVSKTPPINPVRAPIANPFDILNR